MTIFFTMLLRFSLKCSRVLKCEVLHNYSGLQLPLFLIGQMYLGCSQMCLESNVLAVLAAQHRENSGLSREEAELQYIREAVLLEAPLNAHLYRLRRSKNEAGPGRILLAICARGVRIYAEEETSRVFAWNNIGKLSFDVSF